MLLISLVIFIRNVSPEGFEVYLQARKEDGPLDGLLEFPGGKIEPGETPEVAAIREVKEEVLQTIEIDKLQLFHRVTHAYPDRKVCLFSFLCFRSFDAQEHGRWERISFFENWDDILTKTPKANHQILSELVTFVKKHAISNVPEKLWQK